MKKFVWLLVVLLLVASAVAQETTAGIQGTVKDPTGAVVSKATVEVTGRALIGSKKMETDGSGYYRFTHLPPGEYLITTTAAGFRTSKLAGIKLEVGKLPTIDLKLEIGGNEQVVEVSGVAPMVDTTQSKVAVTVSSEVLNSIPKGRSFESLIPFAPGARQEPLTSTTRGGSLTGAAGATGYQIDGASDSENTYMSEGMDTTGVTGGGSGNNVPMEFIQEVQIKTGGFEAEFGGALGGVVNVVQKRGGNDWHGSVFSYYRSDAFNANDTCLIYNACGLRYIPGTVGNYTTSGANLRTDRPTEYYRPKKDHYRTVEPGYEAGGYLLKDRLWLFSSFVPSYYSRTRTVNFTGAVKGPYTFRYVNNTYNALNRLDYMVTSKIRTFASWQYGYNRISGNSAPDPDPAFASQVNNSATVDPRTTYRADAGSVNPNSVIIFGGDVTITPNMVATARYGKWFTNSSTRGAPVGIRYIWQANGAGTSVTGGQALTDPFNVALPGNFGAASTTGSTSMPSNVQQLMDAYHRNSLSTDVSYFAKFFGTHNFKVGYSNNRITNDLASAANFARVDLYPGQAYSPIGTSCPAAATVNGQCRGTYGYYKVYDFVSGGLAKSLNHALYFQDAWTLGKGVTVNAGLRFDKEYLPPYSAGATDISFGFGDKIAPRLGAAWDVLRNGKLKIYGSYGTFFDIMKYSLPRGSFGGEYWHECVYTLNDTNYTGIQPAMVGTHTCAGTGPATGTTPGTFIENFDFRKPSLAGADPGVDPNLKPMSQWDMTLGVDYAVTSQIGFEARYSRKRLRNTIEDIGIVVPGGELYKIGNPGANTYANLLNRPIIDGEDTYDPQCASCPLSPKATRNYDGVEFRVIKRASNKWYGTLSYTYSRLYGNYSGLTSSDVNDAASVNAGSGGGRHNPNNNRSFDSPNMQFTADGTPAMGPLGTDRPHTFKAFGYYRLKYWKMETLIGGTQVAYQGTPQSTCWPSVTTQSACSFVENRGNWVNLHRDATTGNIVSDGVIQNRRSPAFTQTDLTLVQDFKPSKTHEQMRIGFEANVSNLFNQRSVLTYMSTPLANSVAATPHLNDPNLRYVATDKIGGVVVDPSLVGTVIPNNMALVNWNALTGGGWDYIAVSNTAVNTAGTPLPHQYSFTPATLNSMYGQPTLFQGGRTLRLKLSLSF
ncbi:MAG TPA: carboxypeptidase regulatory-like domain-containing protein [Clostridia bacterium]|nr:carboxypeptidase regulatory-like domain-containing protein [Clostridia bacterium]